MGLEIPILGEITGKIEILSTRNLLYGKFADMCRKIASSFPQTFSNSKRRCTPVLVHKHYCLCPAASQIDRYTIHTRISP